MCGEGGSKLLDGWKAGHESTMCARRSEGQPYPGLHQKKCGQQVEWGDSASLLCSGKTPPAELSPSLDPSAQGHGPIAVGPEGHRKDQRGGTALIWGQTERVGAVQPGEEKALGKPYCSLSVFNRGLSRKRGGVRGVWYSTCLPDPFQGLSLKQLCKVETTGNLFKRQLSQIRNCRR